MKTNFFIMWIRYINIIMTDQLVAKALKRTTAASRERKCIDLLGEESARAGVTQRTQNLAYSDNLDLHDPTTTQLVHQ